MLDKFIFENHRGLRFNGLENGVYMNYSTIRDYNWSYDAINGKISRFYNKITSRKIPLVVVGKTGDEAIAAMNRLHELAEADIVDNLPGKIIVGEYYTNCFITGSKKANYLISKRHSRIDLTITSDDPAWYRDRMHHFVPGANDPSSIGGGTDYPYDYAYDYSVAQNGRKIISDAVGNSAFKIKIYGEATNPEIIINGHVYAVTGTIGKGETLLIDGLNKKITLTTAAGEKVNWFDKRNRESYIFEPIKPGSNVVTWGGSFGFELTVVEKRSEPRWT